MLKTLSLVLISFILIAFASWAYSGGLINPKIEEKTTEKLVVVTKEHRGAYHKVKPAMDEVYTGLKELGVETTRGVGLYHDDPSQVAEADLRSDVGSVLEEEDWVYIDDIKEFFSVKEIEPMQAMVIEFPIKTFLSYMIAPMRVYPAMNKHYQEKGYKDTVLGIEIYDVPNKMSTYIMEIIQD
jgi:hypothetical protein